ncbi:MAG: hypothetical protein C0622_14370 [Desulfuromonas sp.]|nr:MAG: hypothetical protein C0622_14370 [Desulfuromonas sp.]
MKGNNSAAHRDELEQLVCAEANVKEKLEQFRSGSQTREMLEALLETISRQFEIEEQIMERIGLSLTPIHRNEHRKLINEIAQLEGNWKESLITDDVYIKSINYKLSFHDHYFDKTQRLLLAGR